MAEAPEPIIQECATCGALIDVTDEEPLSLMHCPTCGAALRVRRLFNHFELQAVLGAGGMGAVYRARDLNLNRDVALKLLQREHSGSPALIASLASEAAVTASINHPHVVKVYSTGTDHGIFFIAMELVDHGSLEELMAAEGKVPEADVLEVGVQIAQGLNAAWQRGLIHRDVKPGNILFAGARASKIVDFGLAVLQEHANREGGELWGTPYYVAPEKLQTPPLEDFRSDMYSLGATLFHALAGRPPHEATTASITSLQRLKKQPVNLLAAAPELSSATAYVIDKVLSHDPDQRHRGYDELIEHLQYARDEVLQAKVTAEESIVPELSEEEQQRRASWLALGAGAVVVLAGVLWFTYGGSLFGPSGASGEAEVVAGPARAAAETRFQEAVEQIVAGRYAEAAAALRALDAEGTAPQPLRNWITMHAGLTFVLSEQFAEAQAEFSKIAQRGIYTPDPLEQKIAGFFVETARLAAQSEPVPASALQADRATHEAFAWFLLGAKNWDIGAFTESAALLRQFQSAPLTDRDAWIARYQPIAAKYLADLETARPATEATAAASTLDTRRAALPQLRAARGQLKLPGKLVAKCDALAADLEKQIQADEQERARRDAALVAADKLVLAEAMKGTNACWTAFRFTQGAQIIAAADVKSDWGKAERAACLQRTEWLAQFKAILIKDINAAGYRLPLLKKNGSQLTTGLQRATELQAEMVTPYGSVPVMWSEISSESIAAMAASFLGAATSRPDEVADRNWRLGVFLHWAGKRPDALALLERAAQAKAGYQPHLALFRETPAAPAP